MCLHSSTLAAIVVSQDEGQPATVTLLITKFWVAKMDTALLCQRRLRRKRKGPIGDPVMETSVALECIHDRSLELQGPELRRPGKVGDSRTLHNRSRLALGVRTPRRQARSEYVLPTKDVPCEA